MTQELKYVNVNNIFSNTVNQIAKELEVCLYKITCIQHNIEIEFNRPLGKFDSKHFIYLCLLIIVNKHKFINEFHKLCDNAREQIKSINI